MKRLAIVSALALASSTAGATMLLLGAGGGSGGGGGPPPGPATIYECNDSYTLISATAGSPSDGYRTITTSGAWGTVRAPASTSITVANGTTYKMTLDIDTSTSTATYIGAELKNLSTSGSIFANWTVSNGSYASGTNVASYTSTPLGGGKYRVTWTGSSSNIATAVRFQVFACENSSCTSSPASTTFTYNTSTCKVETP